MKIGDLARRVGIGVETVRFYEREGLLEEPPRRESGYREYPLESVARLRFIRHAKELGFSLQEIQELLTLRARSEAPCTDVQRRIETKLAAVRGKILSLKQLESMLEDLAASCDAVAGTGGTGECPVLEVLERADKGTGS